MHLKTESFTYFFNKTRAKGKQDPINRLLTITSSFSNTKNNSKKKNGNISKNTRV